MKTGKITKRQHALAPQDPSETTPRGEQHNKKIARGENQKEDEEAAATIEDKEAVCANVDSTMPQLQAYQEAPTLRHRRGRKSRRGRRGSRRKDTARESEERPRKRTKRSARR